MDDDGYPSEDELARIRTWDAKDCVGLLEYVRSLWWQAEWGFHQKGRIYSISTGGWSGNESLIEAMVENIGFWLMCWVSNRRGGHYKFQIPNWQWEKVKDKA